MPCSRPPLSPRSLYVRAQALTGAVAAVETRNVPSVHFGQPLIERLERVGMWRRHLSRSEEVVRVLDDGHADLRAALFAECGPMALDVENAIVRSVQHQHRHLQGVHSLGWIDDALGPIRVEDLRMRRQVAWRRDSSREIFDGGEPRFFSAASTSGRTSSHPSPVA